MSDDLEDTQPTKTESDALDGGEAENASDSLENAPDEGETLKDFFSFEEIFRRILATADDELEKNNTLLLWSGLAAGLSLGLTFLARVLFTTLSGNESPGLVGNLFYPVGFLLIVIGRYQLFTENTLTPVVLVLTKLASLRNLLRLWGVVFVGNMVGALVVTALLAFTGVLNPEAKEIALKIGEHANEFGWSVLFWRAVVAGWLVASMVWLVHGTRDTVSKIAIVWILMFFIGAGELFHVITSSVEVFFVAFEGETAFLPLWSGFVLPVLLGNIAGGVVFVAVLNYMQFGEFREGEIFEHYGERLSWRDWLFSHKPDDERHSTPKEI